MVDAVGNTFLHLACRLFQLEIIEYFVTKTKHDLLPKNNSDKTPLQIFCGELIKKRVNMDKKQQSIITVYCLELPIRKRNNSEPGEKPMVPYVDCDGTVLWYNSVEELRANHPDVQSLTPGNN